MTGITKEVVTKAEELMMDREYDEVIQLLTPLAENDSLYANYVLMNIKLYTANWDGIDVIRDKVERLSRACLADPNDIEVRCCNTFLPIMNFFDGEECRMFAEKVMEGAPARKKGVFKPRIGHKIAYVSSEWTDHPLGQICLDPINSHNRQEFQFDLFNTSQEPIDDQDEHTKKFQEIADLIAVGHKNDKDLAEAIKKRNPTFCFELNGSMTGNRLLALQHPTAPIVLTIFGFPGTTGTEYVDYFIGDTHTIPLENARKWFTESVAYMEDSCYTASHFNRCKDHRFICRVFTEKKDMLILSSSTEIRMSLKTPKNIEALWGMVTDKQASKKLSGHTFLNTEFLDEYVEAVGILVTTRQEFGLPDDKFIFGCLNQSLKIEPRIFSTWMKILEKTPNSVLVLLTSHDSMANNITKFAPESLRDRLFFFPSNSSKTYHRVLSCVDTFLDPKVCSGHTSTLDCIWSGGPVVTILGNNYHTRVGKTMLWGIRMPGLVANNEKEYTDMAVLLGTYPDINIFLRDKIAIRKLKVPLFDCKYFTFCLEKLLKRIFQRYTNNLPPADIPPLSDYQEWHDEFELMDTSFMERLSRSASQQTPLHPEGGMSSTNDNVAENTDNPTIVPGQLDVNVASQQTPLHPEGGMSSTNDNVAENTDNPTIVPGQLDVNVPSPDIMLLAEVVAPAPAAAAVFHEPIPFRIFTSTEPYIERIRVNFRKPSMEIVNAGNPQKIPVGQQIGNFVCVQTSMLQALKSLMSQKNINSIYDGPMMANRYIQVFEESWAEATIPVIPVNREIFTSEKSITFMDEEQYKWALKFFDAEGNNKFPEVVSTDTIDLTALAECLSDPSGIECDCCGRILATILSPELRQRHQDRHSRVPKVQDIDKIYHSAETKAPHPVTPFQVDCFESMEQAIARYKQEGVAEVHYYHNLQIFVTFSMWLSPAVHRVIKHLRENPALISGTGNIGYEIKGLLHCHLATLDCPLVNNIFKMGKEARENYCKTFFKFIDSDHLDLMMKGLISSNSAKKNGYQARDPKEGRTTDVPCKLCGIIQPTAESKITDVINADHVLPPSQNKCITCGFEFNELCIRQYGSLEQAQKIHKRAHQRLEKWNEYLYSETTQSVVGHSIDLKAV